MEQQTQNISRYMDCQLAAAGKGAHAQQAGERPFVTIAREVGAGGTSVANALANLLNASSNQQACPWTVFDKKMVNVVLEEHNLPQQLAEFMPEKRVSEIRDMIEEMAGLHPAQWTLVKKTAETIMHLGEMGNSILVGRGGNIITRKLPYGVHIRLIGSKEKRLIHTQEYYKLSAEDAAKFMTEEDKGRKAFVKDHFGFDVDDATLYDLVINTDRITYQDAAQLIKDLIEKRIKNRTK